MANNRQQHGIFHFFTLLINTSVGAETDNAKLVIDMLLTGRLTFSGLELTIINL